MKRYPGIRPFRTDEQALFFGRDTDIERLHRLIGLEQVVILYGKSGYGKSSLLSAGIFPKLKAEGLAAEASGKTARQFWEIRFGPCKPGESTPPAEMVRHALARHATAPLLLPDALAGPSIWQAAKNCQQAGQGNFLLVFDQFEELFSYPPEQILEFKKQLAEALYAKVPRRVETALAAAALSPEAEDALYAPFDLKVVFSIRADRMSQLNALKDYLPNLLQNGYELDALDEAGARAAVVAPAGLGGAGVTPSPVFNPTPNPSPKGEGGLPSNKKLTSEGTEQPTPKSIISGEMKPPSPLGEGLGVGLTTGEAFDTPPFTYSPAALTAIFTALRDDRNRIETSTLQIICRYVEDNLVGERAGVRIEAADLGDIKAIFRQFYERTIARLPEAEQIPARRLVEDRLIKDGVRIPYAAQALLAEPDISQELLDELSAASLLRVQRDEQGRMLYEVGHDTLVAPITEAALARRAEEEQAAERELLRLESERQEAERKKIARARRRNIIFSAAALFLLLFAFWQNIEATRQKEEAEKQKALAEERTTAALAAEARADEKDSLARKAQIEADTAQAIADRKTEEARLSAEATAQAMIRLGHSTAQVVDALVREANSHIYHLKYDAALGKLEAAARLNKTTPDFTHAALELAFYFNEAGESQSGQLGQVLGLLGQARPRSREACADYLRRSDPIWYKKLLGKYYPLMLPVAGGEFWMGCDSTRDENCGSDETPRRRVQLNSFELAETETTNWQYNLFCTANGRKISEKHYDSWGAMRGDDPLIYVSWYDAVEYANWLSAQFNLTPAYEIDSVGRSQRDGWGIKRNAGANGFRLPTEAEWEYAARGGARQSDYIYAGANRDSLNDVAWYNNNSSRTNPVRTKRPNPAGFYDMSGNVWEWCWDWYGEGFYAESRTDNPTGPDTGDYRCLRGGSWSNNDYDCRLALRGRSNPFVRNYFIGVRLSRHSQ